MNEPVAAPPPRCWRFAGIELNEAEGRLKTAGRLVTMPPMSMRLLRVLLHAAPNVVPREELLARVWNRSSRTVSRNVLSTGVGRLRQAIGDEQERIVVAVPGVGYRIAGQVDSRPAPGPMAPAPSASEGDRFVLRLWLDALRGHDMLDPHSSVYDAVRADIEQVERELADAPLLLARLHRGMAERCLAQWDPAAAIDHFSRALALTTPLESEPATELALIIHFELCFVLAIGIWLEAGTQNLMRARQELALARAAMDRVPEPSAAVRLKAAAADWAVTSAGGDWAGALRISEALVAWISGRAGLDAEACWQIMVNHVLTLFRAGEEERSVAAIDALLEAPERPLSAGHILHMMARMNQGAVYVLTGRAAEAVSVLQPLHRNVIDSAAVSGGIVVAVARWLGLALHAVGRTEEGLIVMERAYGEATARRGASSELALEMLESMSRLLAATGRVDEAVKMLRIAVSPRLRRLAMPGHRYGVLALARWIEMLIDRGDRRRAEGLLRWLRPDDLRAAALRQADATALLARFKTLN